MVLHMNTSLNTKEPYSQFWTRVDGGPLIAHTVAPGTPTYNVSLCDPTCTASPTHLLEVIVKSTSETIPRWVATHQASSLPLPCPCRIQLYSRTCVFTHSCLDMEPRLCCAVHVLGRGHTLRVFVPTLCHWLQPQRLLSSHECSWAR